MPIVEFANDIPALNYIRERGYCSYSSMKNVRDCETPNTFSGPWGPFGNELHSRLLENRVGVKLTDGEELQLVEMLYVLRHDQIVKKLLAKSINEIHFGPKLILDKYDAKNRSLEMEHINGTPVYGRIDAWNPEDNVCDLKSTKITNMKAFVEAMDFLQAALYMRVASVRDFYYIGVCKQRPYTVMVFNVQQYPKRLNEAFFQLNKLLMYIRYMCPEGYIPNPKISKKVSL